MEDVSHSFNSSQRDKKKKELNNIRNKENRNIATFPNIVEDWRLSLVFDIFCCDSRWTVFCADEALQRQEKIWQQEVEESLSFCSSLSHPSRPKLIDFLRITAPEDDLLDTPTSTPLPFDAQVSSFLLDGGASLSWRRWLPGTL